jgi:hypothetical protein
MARLQDFRSDTRAIADGAWVRVDEAMYDDLEILTRGFTDAFVDAQNRRLAKAAQPFSGEQTRIPNAVRRAINAGLLKDHLVLGVRNLLDEHDQPVTLEAFVEMLADPAYGRLARACFDAAGQVSVKSAEQLEHAAGNSVNGFAGS